MGCMGNSTKDGKIENNEVEEDKLIIEYQIKEDQNKINIFGQKFVENNKNKCKIIVEGKEFDLKEKFNLTNCKKEDNKLTITLKGINSVTNLDYMFCKCTNLSNLPDISKWNTKNVTSMEGMFSDCINLLYLPDISN